MMFLSCICPRDIQDPDIKVLMKEYENRFGEELVYSSWGNCRQYGLAHMEKVYRGVLEKALKEGKPFEPPDMMAAARELGYECEERQESEEEKAGKAWLERARKAMMRQKDDKDTP